ncbi:MAG: M20/M25/M40 family metallo-hydrolase [Romboutsia sp.]|uniref:M20/M25/M40 family metallo-hydrolase n=1 Tax=Romboutsia sp. TaxID=1965302 RepID=UPI003F2A1750
MATKKQIYAVLASTVIAAPILFTSPVSAGANTNTIFSKLERQLSVNRIIKDIERLSMDELLEVNKDNARVTGFEGEHEAARYIQGQFDKLGLSTDLLTIDNIDGFIDEGSTCTVDESSITVKTMTYSQPTNETLEGELVYAGLGRVEDFQEGSLDGKIALIERGEISFGEKAKNAYAKGAKGVIIYNNTSGMLNGTLGSLEESKVPTVGMSSEDGSKLVDRLEAGETVKASLKVDTQVRKDSYSYNVVGEIAANKGVKNPQTIVIGAHFDSVSCPGANDNASGTATILEVAKLLSQPQIKSKLQYNVRFVAFGAEEIGLIGSKEYVDQLVKSGEAENIAGMINLDMVGTGDKLVTYNLNDSADHKMTDIAETSIKELGYTYGGHYNSGSSDHAPFEASGIPAVFIQVDKDPYYHTDEDTVDKIDPFNIEMTSKVVLDMVMDMNNKKPQKLDNKIQKTDMLYENQQMPRQ